MLELEDLSDLLYIPIFSVLVASQGLSLDLVSHMFFPVDKYDTLEYSRVKCYIGIHALADYSVCVNKYQQPESKKCSIKFYLDKDLNDIFFLPLTVQASAQLSELQQLLQERHLTPNLEDQWTYVWGSSIYHPRKAYSVIVGTQQASPLFSLPWQTQVLLLAFI